MLTALKYGAFRHRVGGSLVFYIGECVVFSHQNSSPFGFIDQMSKKFLTDKILSVKIQLSNSNARNLNYLKEGRRYSEKVDRAFALVFHQCDDPV